MKSPNIKFLTAFAALVVLPAALSLTGCGPDTSPAQEDPAKTKARVDTGKQIREFYDKSSGNYDSLSDADKVALDKLTGSSANSKEAFSHMFPSTPATNAGAPSGGGLAPSGPGVH